MRVLPLVVVALLALVLSSCTSNDRRAAPSPPATANASSDPGSAATSAHASVPPSTVDWPTYHFDAARGGLYPSMPAFTGSLTAYRLKLDAAAYASPIIVNGVTVVATENDTIYGLDDSGRQLWRTHLGEPARSGDLPCGNIDPSGITGTPVYDATTGLAYVVAEYRAPVRHELVAFVPSSGAVRWRLGVDLPGADPVAMQVRGALAVAGGRVWVPFGGRAGDCGDYKGRLVGIGLDGSGAPLSFTVPTPREGGIWTPPGAAVDSDGRLLVAVGNGENGPGDAYDYSDSVLAIDPATARLVDSFSPSTWADDNANDRDLGSQGPAIVGQWVFSAGKSGTAYVLRRQHFGGVGGQVSQATLCRSFGGTAVAGDVVYVPCTDGVRAVRIDASGAIHEVWHAERSVAGSPVLGGGRVWAIDVDGGVLHALDSATGRSTARVHVGPVSRFATPALDGTRLVVPTLDGVTIVNTR